MELPIESKGLVNEIVKEFNLPAKVEVVYKHIYTMLSNNGKNKVNETDCFNFLLQCKNLQLNPLTSQIYGFVNRNKLVTIVSLSGWREIANRNAAFDGVEYEMGEITERELCYDGIKYVTGNPVSTSIKIKRKVADFIRVLIYRKDRSRPTAFTTYFDEAYRPTQPWATQPMQMLQNRAFCNAVKNAFSIDAYTEDDRDIIIENQEPMINIEPEQSVEPIEDVEEEKPAAIEPPKPADAMAQAIIGAVKTQAVPVKETKTVDMDSVLKLNQDALNIVNEMQNATTQDALKVIAKKVNTLNVSNDDKKILRDVFRALNSKF